MTVSQRSRFITPKAIRKISDRTEGALTRRTRHRGIKTAKKLIKGPVWEQCRSLPRIYPSLWRTSTGTVQMPAGVAPTDSPALNFLSSALATAAVLNLGDAKPDLHRQFDDLGAGGGGQGGLQFHSHRTSDKDGSDSIVADCAKNTVRNTCGTAQNQPTPSTPSTRAERLLLTADGCA